MAANAAEPEVEDVGEGVADDRKGEWTILFVLPVAAATAFTAKLYGGGGVDCGCCWASVG